MTQSRNWPFYSGVFLSCACVMALQILQSRIFSVVTWYHLSFLVISIAMFGLTLGALSVYRGDEQDQRKHLSLHLGKISFLFGANILFSLFVQLTVPIVSDNLLYVLLTLPVVAGITACAYYQAGKLVSLCLTRSQKPVGMVYGADLIGASAGCLGALFLMQTLDAPTAILVIAALAILAGNLFTLDSAQSGKGNALVAGFILLLALVNIALPRPVLYTMWSKGIALTQSNLNYEKWNSISRVTVINGFAQRPVFLWGASPKLPPKTRAEYQYLMIDGDASTPITKFDGHSWNKLKYLEYDVTNTAYFLPGLKSAAIIGVGGGRDLLSARYFGVKKTIAMDVNPIQVNLLTKNPDYAAYANLNNLDDSRIVVSEARNWFSRSDEKFDIIQMSLIDTWAATGAGAFALSENSIYTVDAFDIFMNDLNKNGVLTVSRWQSGDAYNEIGRMLSMTVAALQQRGVKEPWKNIIVTHSGNIATMVAGRDPLTDAQLAAIEKAASKYAYKIVISPRKPADNEILNRIVKAETPRDLHAAISGLPFDLSPPTDMRPFFFNQAPVTKPWQIARMMSAPKEKADTIDGHILATLNLYMIILFSTLVAALVLILPFRNAINNASQSFVRAGTAYFAMIGLGFMFVEIALMQIMTMFLGHPVYSLGIVLFSLILSTGLGSILSEKHPLRSREHIIAWCGLIFTYVAVMSFTIDPVVKALAEQPFLIRVMASIGIIMPCGILMGYAFPTGMTFTESVAPKMTAWFWGINGACGVVASGLAVFIGIGWGLDKTLLAGGLLYALLALPALRLYNLSRQHL